MKLFGKRVRTAVLAVTMIATAGAIAPAHAADEIVAKKWETYTNNRYGVLIDYPADLFARDWPPPDNAGRNFDAPAAHARFYVYSHANALDQSREDFEAEDVLDLSDPSAKKQNGEDWYQLIATKDDQTIVRRVLLSEGATMVHRLEIAFPSRAAAAFTPIVERMTKSFRVDPTIPEKASEGANTTPPSATPAKEWQRTDSGHDRPAYPRL